MQFRFASDGSSVVRFALRAASYERPKQPCVRGACEHDDVRARFLMSFGEDMATLVRYRDEISSIVRNQHIEMLVLRRSDASDMLDKFSDTLPCCSRYELCLGVS